MKRLGNEVANTSYPWLPQSLLKRLVFFA